MLVLLSEKQSNEHAQKGLVLLSQRVIAIPMDTVMTTQALKTLITVLWGVLQPLKSLFQLHQ